MRPKGKRTRIASAAGGAAVLAAGAQAAAASAADFTVSNLGDAGAGSLRQALVDANLTSAPDRVLFQAGLSGTITLATGAVPVYDPVQVIGPGPGQITVDGNDASRIFYVSTDPRLDVTLSGMTLTGGDAGSSAGGAITAYGADLALSNLVVSDSAARAGGGVSASGRLSASAITVSGNESDEEGGGISAEAATISGSTITDNEAGIMSAAKYPVGGGGIATERLNLSDSTVTANRSVNGEPGGGIVTLGRSTIAGSTISGNSTNADGGAIFQYEGSLTITDSTISGNVANDSDTDGYGGGIYGARGDLTVTGATFSGNFAGQDGGAIYMADRGDGAPGSLLVQSSTLAGNTTGVVNGNDQGGGIWFCCGENLETLTVRDSTISGNSTAGDGGGIYAYGDNTAAPQGTITNSIVAGNSAGLSAPDLYSFPGAPPPNSFSIAFSLIGNTAGSSITESVPGSNIFNADPLLGPLASNGGPTQTFALGPNSPAVDRGSTDSMVDQRGNVRPADRLDVPNSAAAGADGADMGAFELAAPQINTPLPRCQGTTATIVATGSTTAGTPARDVIVGRPGADRINSGGGNDLICALGGNDKVNAGTGNDKVYGAAGNDKLQGGGGNDLLSGAAGKDSLFGQGGKDRLQGAAGKDTLIGGPGKDKLAGGAGKDIQKQ